MKLEDKMDNVMYQLNTVNVVREEVPEWVQISVQKGNHGCFKSVDDLVGKNHGYEVFVKLNHVPPVQQVAAGVKGPMDLNHAPTTPSTPTSSSAVVVKDADDVDLSLIHI